MRPRNEVARARRDPVTRPRSGHPKSRAVSRGPRPQPPARGTGLVPAVSGCHCTADAEPVAGSLHRLEGAVGGVRDGAYETRVRRARTGGGGSSPSAVSPTRLAQPGAGRGRRPSTAPNTSPPGECSSCPTRSGVCWSSVPPACTAITCMPRQTPSTGRPAASAASSSASSQASRSARQPAVRGCGSASYGSGSTSAPPVITSPSSRATTASARRLVEAAAAARVRRPHATTASAYCAGSTSARWSHTPHRACSR